MTSRKIENLSIEDLKFLESLLNKKFNEQYDKRKEFQTKNGWGSEFNSTSTRQLSRCLDAIRGQRQISQLNQDKW
jgi:hypothetical protein